MSMNYKKQDDGHVDRVNEDSTNNVNFSWMGQSFIPEFKNLTFDCQDTNNNPIIKNSSEIMQDIIDALTKTDFRQLYNPSLYSRL